MSIREATHDLHETLEKLPFNQAMFDGAQTNHQRAALIHSNIQIFSILDPLVPDDFRREWLLQHDFAHLESLILPFQWPIKTLPSTTAYTTYLKHVTENIDAHVYLNFMGFMYGGQIMKKLYPNSSSFYNFAELPSKIKYMRENIVSDTPNFIQEVRIGFKFHHLISKELQDL